MAFGGAFANPVFIEDINYNFWNHRVGQKDLPSTFSFYPAQFFMLAKLGTSLVSHFKALNNGNWNSK